MSFNLIEAFIFFLIAFVGIFAVAMLILSVCLLIRWIRDFANKKSKPYRIRIGIALLVISIMFMLFYCVELLPNLYWPFSF